MDNLALEIINDEVNEGFVVDNDSKAEWAIQKIREEQAELRRYELVCNDLISQYQMKLQQAKEQFEKNTIYFKNQLEQYFNTITPKATKTQATYKLPTGTLKRKFGTPDFVRDNEKLIVWLKETGKQDLVKVKEEANWAELKKTVMDIKDGKAITSDGEVIEGVTVNDKPDTFEIEI